MSDTGTTAVVVDARRRPARHRHRPRPALARGDRARSRSTPRSSAVMSADAFTVDAGPARQRRADRPARPRRAPRAGRRPRRAGRRRARRPRPARDRVARAVPRCAARSPRPATSRRSSWRPRELPADDRRARSTRGSRRRGSARGGDHRRRADPAADRARGRGHRGAAGAGLVAHARELRAPRGVPSSDADTGLVWHGDDADRELRAGRSDFAARVMEGLDRCGLDGRRARRARRSRAVRALGRRVARRGRRAGSSDPGQENVLDRGLRAVRRARRVRARARACRSSASYAAAAQRPLLVRLLARLALTHRPPTGFRRDVVVEHSGEHRGTFDIKRGGDAADRRPRALGRARGRLARHRDARAARRRGRGGRARPRSTRERSTEAWDLVVELRLEHQVEQLRAGRPADDHLDPGELNPLTRRYLREAFRAVAAVQRAVSNEVAPGRALGDRGCCAARRPVRPRGVRARAAAARHHATGARRPGPSSTSRRPAWTRRATRSSRSASCRSTAGGS